MYDSTTSQWYSTSSNEISGKNMKTQLIPHLQNYTFALQMDSGIDMTERGASLVWNDYLVLILMEEFFMWMPDNNHWCWNNAHGK